MRQRVLDFRLGTVLATSFTGTLSERYGAPIERIPSPERLTDWLALHGLDVSSCTTDDLVDTRRLRESIHDAATAIATEVAPPARPLEIINSCSTHGWAAPTLSSSGARVWRLGNRPRVEDALRVIAGDAIDVISGSREGRLALCASPTCRAAFLDTSQSRTRRWCDMNTCGNRQKKARLHGRNEPWSSP